MSVFLNGLRKTINACNAVAIKIAMVMLMFMLGIITLHVCMRYLVGNSITWSEEVCRFMMVWISFLLFPAAQQKGQNIAVDFLIKPFRYRRIGVIFAIIVELLAVLVLAVCLKYGWEYMLRAKVTTSEALNLPMMWVYVVLPYSFGMTLLCCFERLCELFGCFLDPEKLKACDAIRSGEALESHS